MKKFLLLVGFFFGVCFLSIAHEIRPASLIITEQTPDQNIDGEQYTVIWKLPEKDGRVMNISPVFESDFNLDVQEVDHNSNSGFLVSTLLLSTNKPLAGSSIYIENIEKTLIDVVVNISYLSGDQASFVIQPDTGIIEIPHKSTLYSVISSYTKLGVEHILLGFDHLLFVLALLLLSSNFKKLLKTVTAFTLAHSITLGLTVFGFINLPSAPVEAIIALSIVYLAFEIINHIKGKETITTTQPWVVAFVFGLLHGLGFAGALSEIGLPKINAIYALGFFNVGVEIGQVIFILVASFLLFLLTKVIKRQNLEMVISYAIGSIAMFWLIERLISL